MRMDPRLHLGRRVALAAAAVAAAFGTLFPAGASAQQTPVGLSVSADVTGCHGSPAAGTVVCNLYVSFSSVSGATSYTAEVARPGGGAQTFNVGGGSATLPVGYTGNGEYVVTIKAYGDPAGADKNGVIAKDRSR
jgi:hypothetical protein